MLVPYFMQKTSLLQSNCLYWSCDAGSAAGGLSELDVVQEAGAQGITEAIQKAADEARSSEWVLIVTPISKHYLCALKLFVLIIRIQCVISINQPHPPYNN